MYRPDHVRLPYRVWVARPSAVPLMGVDGAFGYTSVRCVTGVAVANTWSTGTAHSDGVITVGVLDVTDEGG